MCALDRSLNTAFSLCVFDFVSFLTLQIIARIGFIYIPLCNLYMTHKEYTVHVGISVVVE